jgi:hypothetical protein
MRTVYMLRIKRRDVIQHKRLIRDTQHNRSAIMLSVEIYLLLC